MTNEELKKWRQSGRRKQSGKSFYDTPAWRKPDMNIVGASGHFSSVIQYDSSERLLVSLKQAPAVVESVRRPLRVVFVLRELISTSPNGFHWMP
jgi:hypothetical protein